MDILTLLGSTLILGAPLILAAMGGYTSERGGVINIGLEGKMLMAAVLTALVGAGTGSPWLGLTAGIGGAIVLSSLHWLLTQTYRMDHIISGMAINAIAFGCSNFLDKRFADPDRAEALPVLPPILFQGIALLLPILVTVYALRTRGGLRLKAVGSDPDKARTMGVFPSRVRFFGLLATGVFCGIAGVLLVSNVRVFTDGMTAGRGFIALAALIIGGWRPIPTMIACLVFGLFWGLQIQLQGVVILGAEVPRELWMTLPYVATIVALAGFVGKIRPPAGLGKP
jgi:general nucleoside transport system permease protein